MTFLISVFVNAGVENLPTATQVGGGGGFTRLRNYLPCMVQPVIAIANAKKFTKLKRAAFNAVRALVKHCTCVCSALESSRRQVATASYRRVACVNVYRRWSQFQYRHTCVYIVCFALGECI